ncbi:MAG: hypothetical protein ACOC0N_03155 [Chroococcales cyanobacterium]
MDEGNLLILTIYFIIVSYVFYSMYDALDQLISIEVNQGFIKEQLEKQNLQDSLEISFKFKDQYKPENFADIPIKGINKTDMYSLYLDWEQMSLTDLNGRSHRVIRLIPGMKLQLSQPQVFTIVAPGQIVEEKLTLESSLEATEHGFKIAKPLFDAKKLRQAAEQQKRFSLRVMIQFAQMTAGKRETQLHIIVCEFIIKKTPWQKAIAWKPNKSGKPKP